MATMTGNQVQRQSPANKPYLGSRLRSSVLQRGCNCNKRNGLSYECRCSPAGRGDTGAHPCPPTQQAHTTNQQNPHGDGVQAAPYCQQPMQGHPPNAASNQTQNPGVNNTMNADQQHLHNSPTPQPNIAQPVQAAEGDDTAQQQMTHYNHPMMNHQHNPHAINPSNPNPMQNQNYTHPTAVHSNYASGDTGSHVNSAQGTIPSPRSPNDHYSPRLEQNISGQNQGYMPSEQHTHNNPSSGDYQPNPGHIHNHQYQGHASNPGHVHNNPNIQNTFNASTFGNDQNAVAAMKDGLINNSLNVGHQPHMGHTHNHPNHGYPQNPSYPGHTTNPNYFNPGQNHSHSEHTLNNPGHSHNHPGHINNPGHSHSQGDQIHNNPGHPHNHVGHINNPGHSHTHGDQMQNNPGLSHNHSGHMYNNPGNSQTQSAHFSNNPAHTHMEHHSNPDNSSINPGHTHTHNNPTYPMNNFAQAQNNTFTAQNTNQNNPGHMNYIGNANTPGVGDFNNPQQVHHGHTPSEAAPAGSPHHHSHNPQFMDGAQNSSNANTVCQHSPRANPFVITEGNEMQSHNHQHNHMNYEGFTNPHMPPQAHPYGNTAGEVSNQMMQQMMNNQGAQFGMGHQMHSNMQTGHNMNYPQSPRGFPGNGMMGDHSHAHGMNMQGHQGNWNMQPNAFQNHQQLHNHYGHNDVNTSGFNQFSNSFGQQGSVQTAGM